MLGFFQILRAIFQILKVLANLLWCCSGELLKPLRQMALAAE